MECESCKRLEGERDAFKYAHEQWQKSGDRIVSLEREKQKLLDDWTEQFVAGNRLRAELAEERERNWHTGYQKLRAENDELRAKLKYFEETVCGPAYIERPGIDGAQSAINPLRISALMDDLHAAREEIARLNNNLPVESLSARLSDMKAERDEYFQLLKDILDGKYVYYGQYKSDGTEIPTYFDKIEEVLKGI